MTVDEYIANGGTITACPPRVCAHGYSPHTPDHALGWLSKDVNEHGVTDTFAINEKHRKSAARMNGLRGTDARILRERWIADYRAADDKVAWIEDRAKAEGVTVKAIRRRLTQAKLSPPVVAALVVGLTDCQIAEVLELRAGGLSIERIARTIQVGPTVVSSLLKERGMYVAENSNRGRAKKAAQEYIDSRYSVTISDMARKYGVSHNAVKHAIARLRGTGA
jgi:hypothetical protein